MVGSDIIKNCFRGISIPMVPGNMTGNRLREDRRPGLVESFDVVVGSNGDRPGGQVGGVCGKEALRIRIRLGCNYLTKVVEAEEGWDLVGMFLGVCVYLVVAGVHVGWGGTGTGIQILSVGGGGFGPEDLLSWGICVVLLWVGAGLVMNFDKTLLDFDFY